MIAPDTSDADCDNQRDCFLLKECEADPDCSVITDFMVAVKIKTSTPRSQHIACSYSNIITELFHTENCENFGYTETSITNFYGNLLLKPICITCNTITHLNDQDGKCVLKSSHAHCLKNLVIAVDGSYSCECESGYQFI